MEKLNNIPSKENDYLCAWKYTDEIFPRNISLVLPSAVFVFSFLYNCLIMQGSSLGSYNTQSLMKGKPDKNCYIVHLNVKPKS